MYGANNFPFIDMAKTGDRTWEVGGTAEDWFALLDDTGMPTRMVKEGRGYHTFVACNLNRNAIVTGSIVGTRLTIKAVTSGEIKIGDTVSASEFDAVMDNTVVTGQISGTPGGVGIYSVNQSQAVSFRTLAIVEDPVVITHEGAGAKFRVSLGIPDSKIVANIVSMVNNRIVYAFASLEYPPNHYFGTILVIQSINSADPVRNIRMFRKSHEALLKAGKIFNPDYLRMFANYGVVRLLQFQNTINSASVRWENRPLTQAVNAVGLKAETANWYGRTFQKHLYVGTAPRVKNTYFAPVARPGNPSEWTHGMAIVLRMDAPPEYFAITGFTNANRAQVRAPGHTFVNGDQVFFEPGNFNSTNPKPPVWSKAVNYNKGALVQTNGQYFRSLIANNLDVNPFTDISVPAKWVRVQQAIINHQIDIPGVWYTVSNVAGDTFTIDADSTNWGIYTSGGIVTKAIECRAGNLPFKKVTTLAGTHPYATAFGPVYGSRPVLIFVYDEIFDALVFTGYHTGQSGSAAGDGMPLEVLIQLANELNVNPWFCIPHMADDEYVRNMATMVRDNLSKHLIARFELSNEIWNGVYYETPYAEIQARYRWGNSLPSFSSGAYNFYNWAWYGWRFYQVMSIISDVYAGQMNRVKRVFADWLVQGNAVEAVLRYRHEAQGTGSPAAPITRADYIAIAPYVEPPRSQQNNTQYIWQYVYGDTTQKSAALAWLDKLIRSQTGQETTLGDITSVWYPAWEKIVANTNAKYGTNIKLTHYEGGLGIIPNAGPIVGPNPYNGVTITYAHALQFFSGYYESEYAALIIRDSWNAAVKGGAEFPCQYPLTGAWSEGGMFGAMVPNEYGVQTPYFDAVRRFNRNGALTLEKDCRSVVTC